MTGLRLDRRLVERGLFETRTRAQAAIRAGLVRVDGKAVTSPAAVVLPDARLEVLGEAVQFVGRGGDKLAAALDAFGLQATGAIALDVGASIGGFTDCLLQRGAGGVVAVDVGTGQLHPRLRAHPRVLNLERTDVRDLPDRLAALRQRGQDHLPDGTRLPERYALITADLSFISARLIAPALGRLVAPAGQAVLLVKPQFEIGRWVGRAVRDPDLALAAADTVARAFAELGWQLLGRIPSPVPGGEGTAEAFLHLGASS